MVNLFEYIKVGDQVIVNGQIKTVNRVTKTRFSAGNPTLAGDNFEFTKDGREYGKTNSFRVRYRATKAEGIALEPAITNTNILVAKRSFGAALQRFSGLSKPSLEQSEKLKSLALEFLKNIDEAIDNG